MDNVTLGIRVPEPVAQPLRVTDSSFDIQAAHTMKCSPLTLSPAVSNQYKTLPLPPSAQSIRVLEVLSNTATHSEFAREIQAELSIIDLKDEPAPIFTALSYV
jgi:hypothetical protein